jgi:signal transduction histidine kinase
MDWGMRHPKILYALVGASVALLLGLAALQYRWLGDVSRGERERQQANLNTSLKQFAQDFDRELTRIFLAFQLHASAGPDAGSYVQRYRNWHGNTPYPQMVKAVYLMRENAGGELRLARYDTAQEQFTECAWPAELQPVAARFQAPLLPPEMREMLPDKGSAIRRMEGAVRLARQTIAPEVPALIVPAGNIVSIATSETPEPGTWQQESFIVALNLDYLKNEFIPALARQHQFTGPDSDYHLSVTAQNQEVIYQDAGSPKAADATEDLFRVRLEEFDKLLLPGLAANENAKSSGKIITEDHKRVTRVFEAETNGPPPMIATGLPDAAIWRVTATHRAGSLDAAVAQARRRNLLISSGILLLLGASVGFIVVSSRRAQRLAARQMEFVAGVSHELRTPLAVICSAAENLADGVVERQTQIQRYGTLIRDEGRRLGNMVEQVLEFAGAQSGRQVYELRPVSLREVVNDALTPHRQQLAEQNWQLETDLPEDLPLVRADAPALTRAVQNLVSNAIKYGDAGRRLHIYARRIDGFVALTVADQGRGIPADELRHIFEPFTRGREAVAEQIHGNGLGLSLVKHIVTAHGGRVEVTSEPNQGSAFTIYVPVAADNTSLATGAQASSLA